jgi:Protein of unknown function (DUF1488)
MTTTIEFPPEYRVDLPTAVAFSAVVDGTRLACQISYEALKFGFRSQQATSAEALFLANREAIQDLLRAKIRKGLPQDGQIFIDLRDLQ